MTNLVGRTFGRYRLLAELGRGGMATVYRAFDPQLRRDVVVKVLLQTADNDPTLIRRFRQEANTLAALSHPSIVKILDYGEQDGRPYLVMEYITGGTLTRRMEHRMPWREAAALLAPVAQALAYAHTRDIVHRDVKPANILLNEAGVPLLSDFGIAKIVRPGATTGLTGTGLGMGTPAYIAPEQGLGRTVDHRADIYSLGLVFYELITGVRPFDADTPMALVIKHIQETPPRPKSLVPDLPDAVERVLLKTLSKRPEDRYPSMADFAAVLDKLGRGQPLSSAEAPGARFIRPLWALLGSGMAGIVGLSVCVVLGLVALALSTRQPPASPAEIPNGFVFVARVQGEATFEADDGSTQAVRRGALYRSGANTWLHTGLGQVELGLSDGTSAYLGPDSDLALDQVADPSLGVTATTLTLHQGLALAVLTLGDGESFVFQAPTGVETRAQAAVLGVKYDAQTGRLDAECLTGECRLALGDQGLTLTAGQHGWFEGTDGPFGPEAVHAETWSFSGVALPTPTPTSSEPATFTLSPTPSHTRTATRTPTPTPTVAHTQPSATSTRRPATAVPAATVIPPTAIPPTAVPPTAVPPPPPTAVPPTNPPPTNTQLPPTPPPPTNTAPPPTSTAPPPTPLPTPFPPTPTVTP